MELWLYKYTMYELFALIISIICMIISYHVPKNYEGGSQLTIMQKNIAAEYPKMKKKQATSFKEFCFPKKFRLQNPQKFAAEYMKPGSHHMELLGFHRIGAGKTCMAITVAEKWIDAKRGKPLIVMPASLVPGFRNELRGPCPEFEYAGKSLDKEELARSSSLIDSRYDLMSYNKFLTIGRELNPPILIIDEVHNVNNPDGTYYRAFMRFIIEHPKMKLLVLSATPVFDNPTELVSLLRLMRKDVSTDILNNPIELKAKLQGLVSYYAGAPEFTFPRAELHYDICLMSPFQSKWFKAEVEAEIKRSGVLDLHHISNSFYTNSRAKANIVFPHGLSGTDGLPKMNARHLTEALPTYSCKFSKLMRRLKKGQLSFVFTNFASYGGIKSMKKILKYHGFTDYSRGEGPRRYATWTGEQTMREKDRIREIFNSTENNDGSRIQIIIGSPAMKEGVSLFRVRQVHVMEPYWNHSRLEQIYGRAVRFCSHKTLPKKERTVDIYLYLAVTADSGITNGNFRARMHSIRPEKSVDLYILNIADKKKAARDNLVSTMMDAAVDRVLFQ